MRGCLFSLKSPGDFPSHLGTVNQPLMDVSVWQVLVYLAPTVAHSDEAARAGCLLHESRGTLYFTLSQNNRSFPARCGPERLIKSCQAPGREQRVQEQVGELMVLMKCS